MMRHGPQACVLAALLLAASGTPVRGQVDELVSEARSIGMASVGVTTSESPAAVQFNPALLAIQSEPQIFTTLPVTQLVPQLVDDVFFRELAIAVPLPKTTAVPLAFGFNYSRLDLGVGSALSDEAAVDNYVDQAFGVSAAVRPLAWLAVGGRLQWLKLDTSENSVPNVGLGILVSQRHVSSSGAYVEGRLGASLLRWGPDIEPNSGVLQTSGSSPQERDFKYGLSTIFGDRHARVVLAVDITHHTADARNSGLNDERHDDVMYGAEVRMLTVAGRVGYEDSEAFQDTRHGLGVELPFPGGIMGRFDYGQQTTDVGVHDHYTMAIRYAPDERRRLERNGYELHSRFAIGVAGAANSPNDRVFNPGIYARLSSRVGFTDALDLETWFGWGFLSDDEPDVNSTFLNFGGGLRRNFDLGTLQPYGLAGISGSRLGASMSEETTVRAQYVAPGYTLGVGVVIPAVMDGAGLDLALLLHSVRSVYKGNETWVEFTLGASIP
jgi:hypothetical protein